MQREIKEEPGGGEEEEGLCQVAVRKLGYTGRWWRGF
jgi:hypothetical protein